MSRKLKSGWHELKSGNCKPINKQASHGLTGGHSNSQDGIEPIPANSKQSKMTLDQFRIRHGLEYADAQSKYRDYLKIFEPKPVKENLSSVHNPLTAVVVWNADTEKQVRAIIGSGGSVSKALAKAAPKGFISGLRTARATQLQKDTSNLLEKDTKQIWNADSEKQVRDIIVSGGSLPKSLMKAAPKGFVGELRKERKRTRRNGGDWVKEILRRSSNKVGGPVAQWT